MDQEALFPLMGNIVRFGYNFVGWNTEPDGTGTDYLPGQETSLTGNLYLYAKWEAKEPVTLTYIYNDGEGRTDSAQVIPGADIAFPDAPTSIITLATCDRRIHGKNGRFLVVAGRIAG